MPATEGGFTERTNRAESRCGERAPMRDGAPQPADPTGSGPGLSLSSLHLVLFYLKYRQKGGEKERGRENLPSLCQFIPQVCLAVELGQPRPGAQNSTGFIRVPLAGASDPGT